LLNPNLGLQTLTKQPKLILVYVVGRPKKAHSKLTKYGVRYEGLAAMQQQTTNTVAFKTVHEQKQANDPKSENLMLTTRTSGTYITTGKKINLPKFIRTTEKVCITKIPD